MAKKKAIKKVRTSSTKTKKTTPKTQLFVVTTRSTFQHQYLVEAIGTGEALTYTISALISGEIDDCWQQKWLGETVTDVVSTTKKKAQTIHKTSEDGNPWVDLNQYIYHASMSKPKTS